MSCGALGNRHAGKWFGLTILTAAANPIACTPNSKPSTTCSPASATPLVTIAVGQVWSAGQAESPLGPFERPAARSHQVGQDRGATSTCNTAYVSTTDVTKEKP